MLIKVTKRRVSDRLFWCWTELPVQLPTKKLARTSKGWPVWKYQIFKISYIKRASQIIPEKVVLTLMMSLMMSQWGFEQCPLYSCLGDCCSRNKFQYRNQTSRICISMLEGYKHIFQLRMWPRNFGEYAIARLPFHLRCSGCLPLGEIL